VPLLGDIPVLGNLFKTTTKISNRTELLIFITPRVITDRTVAH
jgi:type IV pilus assembly protein PilQ